MITVLEVVIRYTGQGLDVMITVLDIVIRYTGQGKGASDWT